jgi:hypothetical protein
MRLRTVLLHSGFAPSHDACGQGAPAGCRKSPTGPGGRDHARPTRRGGMRSTPTAHHRGLRDPLTLRSAHLRPGTADLLGNLQRDELAALVMPPRHETSRCSRPRASCSRVRLGAEASTTSWCGGREGKSRTEGEPSPSSAVRWPSRSRQSHPDSWRDFRSNAPGGPGSRAQSAACGVVEALDEAEQLHLGLGLGLVG